MWCEMLKSFVILKICMFVGRIVCIRQTKRKKEKKYYLFTIKIITIEFICIRTSLFSE
jgi:hypothetical protein